MEHRLIQDDCLLAYKTIAPDSVDLILTDPPYGILKRMSDSVKNYDSLRCDWDTAITPKNIYNIAKHLLRPKGRMVLFSQEPYTSQLVTYTSSAIDFCYKMIWEKNHFAFVLNAKNAPVSIYEEILVFKKTECPYKDSSEHPLLEYFKKVRSYIKVSTREIDKTLGNFMSRHFFSSGSQFSVPSQKNYEKLIENFGIDGMEEFKPFEEIIKIHEQWKEKKKLIGNTNKATFNLQKGQKYKSNILKYSKDKDNYHPTQKPVLLLEDLIKTFSHEGDLVVDFTMGSGSTGVACVNTGRRFIGIEKDPDYFKTAQERIGKRSQQLKFDPVALFPDEPTPKPILTG